MVNDKLIGANIKSIFKEIKVINTSLLQKEIACIIISVEKNRKHHIKELHEAICALPETDMD